MNPLLRELTRLRRQIGASTERMIQGMAGIYALYKVLGPLESTLKRSAAINITANRLSEINSIQFKGLSDKMTSLPVTMALLEEGLVNNGQATFELGAIMAHTGQDFRKLAALNASLQGTLAFSVDETTSLNKGIVVASQENKRVAEKLMDTIADLGNRIGGMLTILGSQSKVMELTTDVQAKLGPVYATSINKLMEFAGGLNFDKWALLGERSSRGLQKIIEGRGDWQDFRTVVVESARSIKGLTGSNRLTAIEGRAVADMFGTDLPQAIFTLEEGLKALDAGLLKLDGTNGDYRANLESIQNQVFGPMLTVGLAFVPIIRATSNFLIAVNKSLEAFPEALRAGVLLALTSTMAKLPFLTLSMFGRGTFVQGLTRSLIRGGLLGIILGGLAAGITALFGDDDVQKTEIVNTKPIPVKPVERTRTSDILGTGATVYGMKATEAIQAVLNKVPLSDNVSQKMLSEMREQNELLKQVIVTLKKGSSGSMLEGK